CAGFLVAPLLGVFGFLTGMWVSESLLPNDPSAVQLLGIAGAVTFAGVAFVLMRSIHPLEGQCSYVGTDGAVLFERKGKRVKTIALVPFKDVADVRVESTGHGSYGIHTSYLVAFTFVDRQGRTIARIAGMHFPDGKGQGSQSYWLGKRAHEAWQA